MKTSILIHTFFIIKPSYLILYYYLIPSIENARVICYILPGKVSSLYVYSANEFELNRIHIPCRYRKFPFFHYFCFIFCRCIFYSSLIRILTTYRMYKIQFYGYWNSSEWMYSHVAWGMPRSSVLTGTVRRPLIQTNFVPIMLFFILSVTKIINYR